MKSWIKKSVKALGVIGVLGAVSLGLVACGSTDTAKPVEKKEVKVGVVGSNNDVWEYVAKKVEKEHGIKIKLVKFSDYNQPNKALSAGDIDLNAFQHRIFLANYNKTANDTLTPIGDTVIAPLGIYSEKVKDVKNIADGSTIVIPNDVTNGSRALRLLETAGLVKLAANAPDFPTVKDIAENPKNLTIKPVDATQTARSIKDVEAAIINSGIAVDAGFTPSKDAIFLEPVNENSVPYINLIAAREKDKDNETYKTIVKAYQTDDVKKVIEETSKGSSIPAWK